MRTTIKKCLFLGLLGGILFLLSFSFVFEARADQEDLRVADYCVSGVMFDTQEPMAIINDSLVKEGEEIDGIKVLKITDSRVTFSCQGRIFTKEIGQDCAGSGKGFSDRGLYENENSFNPQDLEKMKQMVPFMWGFFVLMVLFYVYSAVCLQKIAIKTQTENPWLAWIPIGNLYLCYLIAKPSIWWFILLFVPYVNIVAMVIIWTGIAQARHKPKWLGVLMLLPLVNFFIMGYLAFSE
ncbi:MAG: DUF5684 domain-containing protein [Candidatus Omnitrophota bacterium]